MRQGDRVRQVRKESKVREDQQVLLGSLETQVLLGTQDVTVWMVFPAHLELTAVTGQMVLRGTLAKTVGWEPLEPRVTLGPKAHQDLWVSLDDPGRKEILAVLE